jgi:hypothetical protein
MALDRTLSLLSLAPPRSLTAAEAEVLERASANGWVIVHAGEVPALAETGWSDLALIVRPGGSLTAAIEALREPGAAVVNPYEMLARYGLLAISPLRPLGDGLLLSGGSYSSVSLRLEDGRPLVHKTLQANAEPDPDREWRQRQECAWMSRLPGAAASLFAPLVSARAEGPVLQLVTEFAPGYSLGEMVFQGRLDGSALAHTLEHIYETVSERVWSLPPLALGLPLERETYPQRIQRRLEKIESTRLPAGSAVGELLSADWVEVNGRRCLSVRGVLAMLEQSRWSAVVAPRGETLCHGDLILEDVVIDETAPSGFRLVDPNPGNAHPVFDVCKTMMSLWLFYESIYYDRFSIETKGRDGGIQIELRFDDGAAVPTYSEAAESFVEFAQLSLAPQLGLPPSGFRALLRMGAAINMLAIPMFHLLHHEKERRALAFLAQGLWHAQEAATALDRAESAVPRLS